MKAIAAVIAFGAVVSALVASRSYAEIGVTEREILIGSCADLEGPTKNRGQEQKEAVEAYFNSINKQGGIHGRRLRLISHDDSYQVDKAPICFNELVKENVFMGAFFIGSGPGVKYATMAETHKVPILGINGGPEFLYSPVKHYVFNVRSAYSDQASSPVNHLWNDLGIKKIGVVYQNDAYGSAVLDGVNNALKKLGGAPAVVASFGRPNKAGEIEGLSGTVDSVKAANPDAIILGGVGAPDAKVVGALRKAGLQAIFVAITNDPKFYKSGEDVEGAVMIQPFPPIERKDLPAVTEYTKILHQSYPKAEATPVGLEAFVDARVIAEALRKAGKDLNRENFIAELENLHDYDVGLGATADDKVSFAANDHKGLQKSYATIIKDGKPVILSDWKSVSKS